MSWVTKMVRSMTPSGCRPPGQPQSCWFPFTSEGHLTIPESLKCPLI